MEWIYIVAGFSKLDFRAHFSVLKGTTNNRMNLNHILVRLVVGSLYRTARLARFFTGFRALDKDQGATLLLTGTFDSEQWVTAFMEPILASSHCKHLVVVTTFPITMKAEGLTILYPPSLLRRVLGDVPSRLLTFIWQSLRLRPFLVGGFHISINALVADLAAALCGARSMYVCTGGPVEIIDGGLRGESKFFSKLKHNDLTVEKQLLRTVSQFDAIVAMGNSSRAYFLDQGIAPERVRVLTGGVNADLFAGSTDDRAIDIIFVGRLVPIKDIPLLIRSIRAMIDKGYQVKARIVGRGPAENELRQLIDALGVSPQVELAGFVDDLITELQSAKCFVLTSVSEGLSLALIEAMLAGAVPVVVNVGDLDDLVENDVTGYLIDSRDPNDFADCLGKLIEDKARLARLSRQAREVAMRCDTSTIATGWDVMLEAVDQNSAA